MSWEFFFFFWQWSVICLFWSSESGITAHLCRSTHQETQREAALDSTRQHHVWSKIAHWLLGCGALGTSLIIYPACVYLCWTMLCGGKGKADTFLPVCMWGACRSTGTAGFVLTFVCVCVWIGGTEVAAIQLCQHELWSDLHTETHTHAHNTFNCQQKKKRSVSRAPLCLMCSTLILPFGDICCCVNYTPPGVLINTHAMTCTSLHTEIPNALYVRGSGMNGGAGMSLKYPKLPFKSP